MPAPLKSYIDRVLNVLAQIDDLGLDKKEIYKELAADGYDRTVVAQVVGHIRKKAAKPGKFAEQSALFDLYLTEYEGTGTVVATHAARELPAHDPETGEIDDTAETPNEAAHTPVGAARQAEEEVRASSAAQFEPSGISGEFTEPQPTAAQTGGPSSLPASVAGPEAVESPVTHSEPASREATAQGAPSRSGVLPPNHDPAPVNSNVAVPRPEGCERPNACGSSSWRKRCFTCQRAWEAAQGQPPEAVA